MTDAIGLEDLIFRMALGVVKGSHLFKGLEEAEHERISRLFTMQTLAPDEFLFRQGMRGDSFFFILDGHAIVLQKDRGVERRVSTLSPGDFFGEGSLLRDEPRRASIKALDEVVVMRMERAAFNDLTKKHPHIRKELLALSQGYEIARRKKFEWLGEDEGLRLVARKHPLILLINELPVLFLASIGLTLLAAGAQFRIALLDWIAYAVLLGAAVWFALRYLDWGDDFYIVTDRRVVWLEETILIYQSTSEAKLTEIRSVDISTDLLQRIFDYGDLHVNTYTGAIIMRNIPQPDKFKALIEEYWQRARRRSRQEVDEELNRRLREKLGLPLPKRKPSPQVVSIGAKPPLEAGKEAVPPTRAEAFLNNFFKMRYMEGDTIVYRTHWILLLKFIFQPTLFLTLLLTGGTYLIINYPGSVLNTLYFALLISFLGWWLYNYWNWHDDKYEITPVAIVDTDRTPLGRENRQTAPLESILSLEHERVGLFGIIFNYGTVSINVGERVYQFEGIHDPARVRQEISDRQLARRQALERQGKLAAEELQLEWLSRYHTNTRELWEKTEKKDSDDRDPFRLK
jgi:hypothetical protein